MFHIGLVYNSIAKSCINLGMSEQFLYLLNRHSLIYCHGGHSTAELVRMDVLDGGFFAKLGKKTFHTGDGKAVPRIMFAYKQTLVSIEWMLLSR